jgi:hypothetical protein
MQKIIPQKSPQKPKSNKSKTHAIRAAIIERTALLRARKPPRKKEETS